jgi:K+-sensing histidine kinase KdpD
MASGNSCKEPVTQADAASGPAVDDVPVAHDAETAKGRISGAERRNVAAVSGSRTGDYVVTAAAALAMALDASWHAIFIETPRSASDPAIARRAAEALAHAARQGATVSNEPGANVTSGLAAHLSATPERLVLEDRMRCGAIVHSD